MQVNKKRPFSLLILLFALVTGCNNASSSLILSESSDESSSSEVETIYPRERYVQKSISRVDSFPTFPNNYKYIDYEEMAKEFDALAFNFAYNPDVKLPAYI